MRWCGGGLNFKESEDGKKPDECENGGDNGRKESKFKKKSFFFFFFCKIREPGG